MFEKRGPLVPTRGARARLRRSAEMTSELDRMFDDWPMPWRILPSARTENWSPGHRRSTCSSVTTVSWRESTFPV